MEGGLRHGDDMTENDGQDRLFGPNPSGLDESPHGMMVLVIVGMIVGLLSGMFGIGGGTVIVPVLVWLGLSQRHAAATSMLAIVPTSISGVISYAHNGNVDWVAAALLSNAQSCYARAELEMTGLAGVLDDVIISSEEKIRKPARDLYMLARDLYMLALDREFVTAKHALMVGNDEQNDIVGARTAGIDGVYFRTEISPADDPETSSYAVRSFTGADYEGLLDYVLNA